MPTTKTNAELFEQAMVAFSERVLTQVAEEGTRKAIQEAYTPYSCILETDLFVRTLHNIIIHMAKQVDCTTALADVLLQFLMLGREMERIAARHATANDVVLTELETWFHKYGNTNLEDGN